MTARVPAAAPAGDDGIEHGTDAAHSQRCYRRYGARCAECRTVYSEHVQLYRQRRGVSTSTATERARGRAQRRLAAHHPRQFHELLLAALREIRSPHDDEGNDDMPDTTTPRLGGQFEVYPARDEQGRTRHWWRLVDANRDTLLRSTTGHTTKSDAHRDAEDAQAAASGAAIVDGDPEQAQ